MIGALIISTNQLLAYWDRRSSCRHDGYAAWYDDTATDKLQVILEAANVNRLGLLKFLHGKTKIVQLTSARKMLACFIQSNSHITVETTSFCLITVTVTDCLVRKLGREWLTVSTVTMDIDILKRIMLWWVEFIIINCLVRHRNG